MSAVRKRILRTKKKNGEIKRFKDTYKPKAPNGFFRFLADLLSRISIMFHKLTVRKHGMDGLRPPFLVLGTHHSYVDLKTMCIALAPHKLMYVVSMDVQMLHPVFLLREIGAILKRRHTQDLALLKNMKRAVTNQKNCVLVLYPEGGFTLDGKTGWYSPALGKLAKFLGVPVVVGNQHGNTIAQPQWSRRKCELEPRVHKGVPYTVDLTMVASSDDIKNLSADEIQARIEKEMQYDDYAWQREHNIAIKEKWRAEGIHKLLYKCPHCGAEFKMTSSGEFLRCNKCSATWEFTELGELRGVNCESPYPYIPDWFDFQRKAVREEVESGAYHYDGEVNLCTLPGSRMYRQGTARLTHGLDGFTLSGVAYGEPFVRHWNGNEVRALHIEYNHLLKSDAIAISTADDSYWCFMQNDGIITKLRLANEEIYRLSTSGENVPTVD